MIKKLLPSIYAFYKNGELICEGTIAEICKSTGYSRASIYKWYEAPTLNRKVELLRKPVHQYEVYDDSGVLFRGTKEECADAMCVAVNSLECAVFETRRGNRKSWKARIVECVKDE